MGMCLSRKVIKNNEISIDSRGNLETKEQKDELYSAICKIKFEISVEGQKELSIGFFCEINDEAIPFKKALFTSSLILNNKIIDINKEIIFEYCEKEKKIRITKDRKVFTNKELEYICIEIFDEDKIDKFFRIDENIFKNKNTLIKKEIYILQYDNGKLSHYSRKILEIDSKIKYNLGTLSCQSGSPLINKYNINLIFGINTLKKEKLDNSTFNLATPFDVIF